jgi:peptidoglycan hydrolase-like protein with peptidoglycan-binding domain
LRLTRYLITVLLFYLASQGSAEAAASKNAKKAASAQSGKRTAAKKSSTKRARRRPVRQTAPTPERYKQIQQALADKGYFTGPIDGKWGPDSVAALKKFQEENDLAVDGKLGALSIIGLGLGPKRDAGSEFAGKPESIE